MKNNYFSRHLLALLCFFACISGDLFAQTMPAAQALPIDQKFTGLAANSTTYPAGFQGWLVSSTQNTSTYSTALSGDRALIASSTANTTSGNIHNFDGKIGFLNTTSADFAIGFAFTSIGVTGVRVEYDAMVIRNPYDGTANYRLQEMALQYRVGISGPFITLPSTAYINNSTTPQLTAVTTPLDNTFKRIGVTLPSDCDNQAVVQIRWIARLASGTSGSRQSYAIDNLDIKKDIVAPINSSGYPKAANVLGLSFDFVNKINEIGKTYYVLLPAGSAEPTVAQIKAGQDANGTAALQSGVFDVTNSDLEYVKSFTGLPLSTAYSVFSISEDVVGNIQAAVNKVDVTTLSVMPPSISPSVTVLNLGGTEPNFDALIKSYQIGASDLTANVVITATGGFTISKDNSTFSSSLTFVPTDFDANATPTVYVKFTPTSVASFTGTITHETTGGTTKIVSLTAFGVNPFVQNFDDANVFSNSGWSKYNEAGPLNQWAHTTNHEM